MMTLIYIVNGAFLALLLFNCCCHLETLLELKYLLGYGCQPNTNSE